MQVEIVIARQLFESALTSFDDWHVANTLVTRPLTCRPKIAALLLDPLTQVGQTKHFLPGIGAAHTSLKIKGNYGCSLSVQVPRRENERAKVR